MQEKTIAKAVQYHLMYAQDDMLMDNQDALKLSRRGIKLFKTFNDYEHNQELLSILRNEACRGWKARERIYDNWMPKIYKGLINTFTALESNREMMTDEAYLKWWTISAQELATPLTPYIVCDKVLFYDDYVAMQNSDIDVQHENLRNNMLRTLTAMNSYRY